MSAELPPQVQNQLMQLQQLQMQLQAIARQKMQVEAMLKDVELALEELEKLSDDAVIYRNVGELMIKASKAEVKEDLTDKKETYDLRLKTLERQEERMQKRFQQLQQQIREALGIATGGESQIMGA
ncbi:MAG TPA: prefoldin subunit beta [Methanomicrobia archaeon]|nr:prefoldin subunit beta [Methanomicrobia archaeon]HEX58929.1 prefoldin subunit beta [Methanomicrobia archaeon]